MASPFERWTGPDLYGLGRVCPSFEKRDGCGTILSRYNPGPLCYCCARRARRREARKIAMAA